EFEQTTGLMYRKSMKEDRGMLFIYENERPRGGFYMKNTYLALDLIYIDANREIVDFKENTEPFNENPLPSSAPAQYVLEVNAGTVAKLGLEIGDKVVFEGGDLEHKTDVGREPCAWWHISANPANADNPATLTAIAQGKTMRSFGETSTNIVVMNIFGVHAT